MRRDQLFERRNTFQRQTMLDLQDALFDLNRMTGAMHHQDVVTYRKTGEWQKQLFGDDLAEKERLAQARAALLVVRVRDESVRKLVESFKNECYAVLKSETQEDSEHAERRMLAEFVTLNHRTGELLRSPDDSEAP